MVCSYVLWPFALVMGVPVADCRQVAALLGIKTILNEYVGYVSLSGLISNRHTFESYLTTNGTWYHVKDDIFLVGTNTTLVNGVISVSVILFMSTTNYINRKKSINQSVSPLFALQEQSCADELHEIK
jgi:hypothetical protein